MKVPYVDIAEQFLEIEQAVMSSVHHVLSSGKYILGEQVSLFEQQFSTFCDVKFSFGVANGTDALIIAMKALDLASSLNKKRLYTSEIEEVKLAWEKKREKKKNRVII